MDISTMQIPRSTETALYDYIISECQEAGKLLTTETNTHNARANYWVAKMLEARAALTAASLARYNTPEAHPQLRTQGGEVGIPAEKAEGYYQTALAAAKEVIEKGPYKLMYPTEIPRKRMPIISIKPYVRRMEIRKLSGVSTL